MGVKETEAKIVSIMDFNLIYDSPYRFLEALSKWNQIPEKTYYQTQYILELSLLDSTFLQFCPSLISCSAFYLVCKLRKESESWP